MIDFDQLLYSCCFFLRDGIVARFVATDGGITRVHPRRYSPFFPVSFTYSVNSGSVKQHGNLHQISGGVNL